MLACRVRDPANKEGGFQSKSLEGQGGSSQCDATKALIAKVAGLVKQGRSLDSGPHRPSLSAVAVLIDGARKQPVGHALLATIERRLLVVGRAVALACRVRDPANTEGGFQSKWKSIEQMSAVVRDACCLVI